ncbi:MAG TPA: V-type ATPase subunit [Candidatus Nitrosotalea sp.]|nr:V-type ATPase subunit [Candidatus Nitrosotalea sp.]
MPTSQYASSFGRLQAISLSLLSKEEMQNLMKAKDETEMVKTLGSTWYKSEIEKAATIFKESDLLEVALNRHLVYINKIALEATPFNGKSAIRAYLSKWDIYNIELILSAKSMGRPISETESFLVSSRNVPAGISAGNISHDEMKIILSQTGVDGVVNQLVKYNYGTVLMQHLETYQKTGDLGPMMSALQTFYYHNLLESLKFFQGDEGLIRDFIRSEIDKKNVLSLLKAKESDLDKEIVSRHIIEGGKMTKNELLDIYNAKDVSEIVGRIENRFMLVNALAQYKKSNSLIDFEVALDKFINSEYVKKLKNIALSIGTIFYFIINTEHERENIKRIAYGKRYNLSTDYINSLLLIE